MPESPRDDTDIRATTSKRAFDLLDSFAARLSMGARKKSKQTPNSENGSASSTAARTSEPRITTEDAEEATTAISKQTSESIAIPQQANGKPRGQGWHGSWKAKAAPSTQVSSENVVGGGVAEASASDKELGTSAGTARDAASSPHKYMNTGSVRVAKGAPKSVPLRSLTSNTNISIVSGQSVEEGAKNAKPENNSSANPTVDEPPLPPVPYNSQREALSSTDPQQSAHPEQTATSNWLTGWWSRPDNYTESIASKKAEDSNMEQAITTPLPASEVSLVPESESSQPHLPSQAPEVARESQQDPRQESRSWFFRWSTKQNSHVLDDPSMQEPKQSQDFAPEPAEESSRASQPVDTPANVDQLPTPSSNGAATVANSSSGQKASGWAFWAKEPRNSDIAQTQDENNIKKQVGEIAVAHSPSESKPEAAQFNTSPDEEESYADTPKKNAALDERANDKSKRKSKSKKERKPKAVNTESSSTTVDAKSSLLKLGPQKRDILLPRFASTYSMAQKPSLLQNIRQYILGGPQEHPHLQLIDNPRRIKNALAIGIHGFFPNAIYQKLLGAPTGTSIKFANMAAAAIHDWSEARGYECKIEKAALEGEGIIVDRVEILWKLLLNWIEQIRGADFILFACHSQGVPVTILLVDRLIKFGCISSAKIGICAMAGVNLGPFAEYRTQIFGRSALELFDFTDPKSKVSVSYRTALTEVLKHNVKVVFIGSMDDQLVSLESSTFSNISHPCIYRAAFIDGRYFSSDFITELVGFALKLRNLGLSDHGLIRELSRALAGSLYSGEGHSRLYESPDVYSLAVSHTLETTSPSENTSMIVQNYEGPPSKDSNPYFLPWAMRGILEEEKVRKELSEELSGLLGLFEHWKPTTKQLKDIRYKLEALKSKL